MSDPDPAEPAKRAATTRERVRGRPGRQAAEKAGRDRLIDSAREIMRERAPVRLQRKQIAKHAGLAPALVTYYFRDEASLIEAAARPIVDQYLMRLKATLGSEGDVRAQLKRVVLLLLEVGRDNGQLLDSYIGYMKMQNVKHKADILTGSYAELARFFETHRSKGDFDTIHPAFVATALWGVCKTMAQLPELVTALREGSEATDQDIAMLQTDLVVEFFIRTIGRSAPS